jgi:Zn ribbon nucleic-acid-binding protein
MSFEVRHTCPRCQSRHTRRRGNVDAVRSRRCVACGQVDKSTQYLMHEVAAIVLRDGTVIHNRSQKGNMTV